MQKFSVLSLLFIFIMISFLLTFGCKDNSTDSKEEPTTAIVDDETVQTDAEAATAALVYAEAMTMPTSAVVSSSSGSYNSQFGKTSTVNDTIYSGCPLITVNRVAREILIDYGTGCTGVSGMAYSGSIFLKGKLEAGKLIFYATFNDFTADDYTLSGTVKFLLATDSIYIDVQDGSLSYDNTYHYLNGKIAIALNLNNTLQNPFDDIYYCSLNLFSKKVVGSEEKYVLQVYTRADSPLEFQLLCEYPYRGFLNVVNTDKSKIMFDFEPYEASCDDVVKVFTEKWPQGVIVSLSDLL